MINNSQYPGNVIVAVKINDLQDLIDPIVQHSETFGLHINTDKTEALVFSNAHINTYLKIIRHLIQQVLSLKYFGK